MVGGQANAIRVLRTGRIPGGGGGYFSEFEVGVCRPVPQILTQFQTKIFRFPHPFSDLDSKNPLIPISDLCCIVIKLRINNEFKN